MKKSLVIILLCMLQAACATPAITTTGSQTLLTYSDLAQEITVGFRDLTNDTRATDDEVTDTP